MGQNKTHGSLYVLAILAICLIITVSVPITVVSSAAAGARLWRLGAAVAPSTNASGASPADQELTALKSLLREATSTIRKHAEEVAAARQQLQQYRLSLDSGQPNSTGAAPKTRGSSSVATDGGSDHVESLQPKDLHHIGRAGAACDKRGAAGLKLEIVPELIAPIVIVAHNRVQYLARCMTTLLRYWADDATNSRKFPLYISIDGHHAPTLMFAKALEHAAGVQVIQNLRVPELCNHGYCHLSQHYKMLLQLFFECHKAPNLLIIEEDLGIAPDFLSYFEASAKLLQEDPSIWCIQAWNDHGQEGRATNNTIVYRTDFITSYGIMLPAPVGLELFPQWPKQYWDDWMRQPDVRKRRQCVFPEVSRTMNFGKQGTSGGQFFDEHVGSTVINKEHIKWTAQKLAYLHEEKYAKLMRMWLMAAVKLGEDPATYCQPNAAKDADTTDLYIEYADENEYKALAKKLAPMMADWRFGPRMGYNGVVIVRCRGRRLFIKSTNG